MDTNVLRQQAEKFKRARGNLLMVIAFTAINLIMTIVKANFYFLFSATVPQVIFEIGKGLSEEFGNNIFFIVGLVIALVAVLLYLLCWIFSKRLRGFMVAALVLFSIDSVVFIWLAFSGGFEASYILDIVFHVWVLFYFINGVLAWTKLRGVPPEVLEALMQPQPQQQVEVPTEGIPVSMEAGAVIENVPVSEIPQPVETEGTETL